MSQEHCNRKPKQGKHLQYSDRQLLEWEYVKNQRLPRYKQKTQRYLALLLGMSEATLSRELRRGRVKQLDQHLREYTSYSAEVAQIDYNRKTSRRGPRIKLGKDYALAAHLERRLSGVTESGQRTRRYSPDAVIMELKSQGWPFQTMICTRTLYNYIAVDVFLTVTQKDLPRGSIHKKVRHRRVRRSHKVPDGRQIEERPQASEQRLEPGHWEMDCIESVKGDRSRILTLVDRYTREARLFKLRSQTQSAVVRALNGLERQLGAATFRQRFKSITVDNGSEFWDWATLEQSVLNKRSRTRIFYAHPYSSWERGSNENLNGFIRYFIPKGTKLSKHKQEEIQELETWINRYPRRLLGGLSPAEFSRIAQTS